VFGGKSRAFVVDRAGVVARQPTVAGHRVRMHSHQTAGLADAATFDDLLQYGANLLLGQGRAEQRRALAFGKSRLAGRIRR
jgi:hypothetical protein